MSRVLTKAGALKIIEAYGSPASNDPTIDLYANLMVLAVRLVNECDHYEDLADNHPTLDQQNAIEWQALVAAANRIRKLLDDKPAELRSGYSLHPGSILNGYREGDINFADAVKLLDRDRLPRHVLLVHFLSMVECHHDRHTDTAICACGWRGDEQQSVGEAVSTWIDHVAERAR